MEQSNSIQRAIREFAEAEIYQHSDAVITDEPN